VGDGEMGEGVQNYEIYDCGSGLEEAVFLVYLGVLVGRLFGR
jgi:hypothetical protein